MQTINDLIDRINRDRFRKDLKIVAYGEFPYTLIDERELDKLIAALKSVIDELDAAIESMPELNTSNYHHEDVCDSESAKSEVYVAWNRLRAARKGE